MHDPSALRSTCSTPRNKSPCPSSRSSSSSSSSSDPSSIGSEPRDNPQTPRLSDQPQPEPGPGPGDDTIHEATMKMSHKPAKTFADLPPELRALIWEHALPETRVFNALVYASTGLKMQLLERSRLRMPLAHVCFESRQLVKKAGYVLAFRDEGQPDDPGVWYNPRRDVIERTIWTCSDFWGWDDLK
ncbi:uncharacterized protein F4812DRAFT_105359 [Daldinia caldariorum]|uniref:uncharacterized protein n=1 Tax=Daldinia caldariorum TaxID=326644 RepID=UPI00200801C7|nr:uncharacterized protein F4812DRAFT_105359 [Daldinia caldariorum]KAI1465656.1 hypothetical protein F4812DRAFT_105359 [Daldinia caldariorum]